MDRSHSRRAMMARWAMAARALQRFQVGAAGLFLAVLVACVAGQFLSRSLFGIGLHWASETARYAFVWCSLLGAAAAWQAQALHRVDVLLRALAPGGRRWLECSVLVSIMGVLVYLAWQGFAITARVSGQTSSTLQISMSWVYAAAPTMAVLMMLSTMLTLPQRWHEGFAHTGPVTAADDPP